MIKKIILSLLIGIILLLAYAPYDPWVKNQIGLAIKKNFATTMDATISFDVDQINLLMPTLILKNVRVKPVASNDCSWCWSAREYKTGFSWIDLFVFQMLYLWTDINNLEAHSQLNNGSLAISPHLTKLMQPAQIPMQIQTLTINKAQFAAEDAINNTHTAFHWSSRSRLVGSQFKTRLHIADMKLHTHERTICSGATGTIFIDTDQQSKNPNTLVRVDARLQIPYLHESPTCFLSGSWRNNHGRFSLANARDTVRIDPIIITQKNGMPWIKAHARVPLALCWQLAHNNPANNDLNGSCLAQLQGALASHGQLRGYIVCDDISYRDNAWGAACKTNFTREKNAWHGDVHVRVPSRAECSGSFSWDEIKNNGTLFASNTNSIALPQSSYWHIPPRAFNLTLNASGFDSLNGSYECIAHNRMLTKDITCSGSLSCTKEKLHAVGLFNQKPFDIVSKFDAFPYVQHIVYGTAHDKEHVSITQSHTKKTGYSGTISIGWIRALIAQLFGYDVQGEGTVRIDSFLDAHNTIKTRMHCDNTTIRLPQTYNFINGLDALINYDPAHKTIRVDHLDCTMHTGALTMNHAVCSFDENGHIAFMHAPLLFDHCLLNVKKDLFAMISGHVLLEKRNNTMPSLRGHFMVDRAQLKENVLSQDLQQKICAFTGTMFDVNENDVVCDLGIETRDAIRVDTPFLQTNAVVDVHVNDTVLNPSISGSISLLSGSLRFPYKPLYITKGSIRFVPGQQHDPHINLIARNKIKQHNVTLHVTGSLLNHQIVLESTPPLAEEQIMSLLFVGSHDQTLNSIMPALIMQNLRHLIFDTTKASLFERYLMPFDKSFHINLIPSFTDQTGRGGLRGSLEINVNDRWRALLQKNFSLTEDTRVELEYVFSDDITVRAIRDERRDLGAEIEMRWKF